ncbi:hypothetical protein, partial [Streptomyces shenzhenensis]|uniref:hypothetical protein n=1 Tax=Streptomyces shenzhenensis TaxID=943815 RepID=UPI001C68876A
LRGIAPYPPVEDPGYAMVKSAPATQTARYFEASGCPPCPPVTVHPPVRTSGPAQPAGEPQQRRPDSDTGNDTDLGLQSAPHQ